ncbi:MAG TPA: helix-turn-helix domain-containing protein [Prolixibacteraceae bacterium]|nr:helix-turn-helix domain-containing protein [Prolixibacteraceae bacterium]
MHLSTNIKFLRKRKRLTQQDLAEALNTKRSSINNYESGTTIPPVNVLIALSDLFHISVDTLLRINLSALRESQMYLIEHGTDVFVRGNEIRILSTTVDSGNRENIELVSVKAKAGYTTGYFDPEFISGLPVFNLPFLDPGKKYRTFQISGDSMLPMKDKSWVVGEFVQDLETIRDDQLYIVLTLNEGIVFKKVKNELQKKGSLMMISTNPEYVPYDLPIVEIREVWKYVLYITGEVPESNDNSRIWNHLDEIKRDIGEIKIRIGKQPGIA